jgi:polygalacturonase
VIMLMNNLSMNHLFRLSFGFPASASVILIGGCSGAQPSPQPVSAGGIAGAAGLTSVGGQSSILSSSTAGGVTAEGGLTSKSLGGSQATGGIVALATGGACGAGDANLPAEPVIPAACVTLQASQTVAVNGVPTENSLDTSRIQSALSSCAAGLAVKLMTGNGNNSFITGPLTIPSGVTLWVDAGTTLYATRNPSVWGSATALISVTGSGSGILGDGTIDGQGGEPNTGSTQSWWDQNAGSSGNSPALIAVKGATNFTLYRITLHNSPKFHVKLGAAGFVVWGVTIKAPSRTTNSVGTALDYTNAHNTDGIDPGEAASNGYIVCSNISTGDDHIALKGSSSTGVTHLVIAHNRLGAGHGMSIGSEFTGGVSDINVYDLSIDGMNMGTSGGSSNGIRIKSDSSRGGLVNNVTYSDVCVRNLSNPILLTPFYSTSTGSNIPQFTNITIRNFHGISGGSNTPSISLDGYDASRMNSITLDNVVVDGILSSNVTASYTNATLGPGSVNFTPSGTNVNVINNISGTSTPNPCTNKWTTF